MANQSLPEIATHNRPFGHGTFCQFYSDRDGNDLPELTSL